MHKTRLMGARLGRRFLALGLTTVALGAMFVAQPGGAQEPAGSASIAIGEVQARICPDGGSLVVPYVAQSGEGVELVAIDATSDSGDQGFSTELLVDSSTTYSDAAVFFFESRPSPATWTVTATVTDAANQQATDESTVVITTQDDCPELEVSILNASVPEPVCQEAAKLTVEFATFSTNGLASVTIEAISVTTSEKVTDTPPFTSGNEILVSRATVEIPAETSMWDVGVTVFDESGESLTDRTRVQVVGDADCDPEEPTVTIQNISVSGPLCPDGATVEANIGLDKIQGSVTLRGTIEGPDGYSLRGEPVTIVGDGTRQTVPWSFDLPVDAPDGQLSLVVSAEGETWGTATATSFMVERDVEACTGAPGVEVSIDIVRVCPSSKTITAMVSARAEKGLKSLAVSNDLDGRSYPAAIAGGEKGVTKSVVFAIPELAQPGTYQLVAEAIDVTGNATRAFRDITLGSVDDCQPAITPTATPTPAATQAPTPTPTPVVYKKQPTATPDPGVYKKPPMPTPTPDVSKMLPTPTPDPGVYKKPGNLAFTGRNSVALALGGLTLIVTGLAVAWDPRSRSFGRRS